MIETQTVEELPTGNERILFVDDTVSVFKSFRWIFMDELYRIFLFDSPIEGLNAIDSKEFTVVIAV